MKKASDSESSFDNGIQERKEIWMLIAICFQAKYLGRFYKRDQILSCYSHCAICIHLENWTSFLLQFRCWHFRSSLFHWTQVECKPNYYTLSAVVMKKLIVCVSKLMKWLGPLCDIAQLFRVVLLYKNWRHSEHITVCENFIQVFPAQHGIYKA